MRFLIAAIVFYAVEVHSSRYRGGTISYRPNPNSPYSVDFLFRFSFRRGVVSCNRSQVENRQLATTPYTNSWYVTRYGSGFTTPRSGNIRMYCSAFSEAEDWSEGYNSFTFTGGYNDNWWMVNVTDGGSWINRITYSNPYNNMLLNTKVKRTRTGGFINFSPVSNIPFTVYVDQGTPSVIRIPVDDSDGDNVRCRKASYQECYRGMCTYFPYGVLDEENCTLSYNGGGSVGQLFPIILKLEDFPRGVIQFVSSNSLGSVDLQFIVHIKQDYTGAVRIQGGGSSGRLQVLHNGVWGTVCDDIWSMSHTHVVCRQLGFAGGLSYTNRGGGTGPIWLDDVQCLGNEIAIQQCRHNGWGSHNCDHNEDIFVTCYPNQVNELSDVRVQGGRSFGLLQVLHNGVWGTVCGDMWSMSHTHVVCRQLGFSSGLSYTNSGGAIGRIWLDDVQCSGNESVIQQCTHNGWGSHNCGHNEDVFVICNSNQGSECTNYVVLNARDRSKNVRALNHSCDHNLTTGWYRFTGDAGTVMPTSCVPMNRCGTHASGWMQASHPSQAEGIVTRQVCYHWDNNCCYFNNSIRVRNCGGFYVYELVRPQNCYLRYCGNGTKSGDVRIQGGGSSGLLQVLHNGVWGTVCGDMWSMTNTHVVCRQLGFPSAYFFNNSGGGAGQIWLDEVQCIGRETSIQQCRHNGWGSHNCNHDEDVFVTCKPNQANGTYGNFTLTLYIYKSSSYITPYSIFDYPVIVHPNKPLFVQFDVKNTNADLVVFAENCRATTSTNPNSYPQHVFLERGCVRDPNMVYLYNSSSRVQRFSIRSFRFVYSNTFLVYLHCELLVCHRNSTNSRCARGCISSRRHGATAEMEGSKPHDLTVGPLKGSTAKSGTDKQEGSSTATIAAVSSVAVVVAILAAILIALKIYHSIKRVRPAPPVNTTTLPGEALEERVNSYEQDVMEEDE